MSDLQELYQEVIIDHNRQPRHCHAMADATHHAQGCNPLCGDQLTLYLKIQGDQIVNIAFQGEGCAISTASASLMTEALLGKTIKEAQKLFKTFHAALTAKELPATSKDLGKLQALIGVREFPMRVKCATLAWHTFDAALHHQPQPTSTE